MPHYCNSEQYKGTVQLEQQGNSRGQARESMLGSSS